MVKSIAIVILLMPVALLAQSNKSVIIQGNEFYNKKQFEEAANRYQQATDVDKKDPIAPYNLGNALRQMNKLPEAEKAYALSADRAATKTYKSQSVYNRGVSLTRQNKLEESINAYKAALRLNPNDQQARENLQLALNQLKKQSSGGGGGGDNDKDNNKQNDKPQQSKNKSKMNDQKVDQMLDALRQDEKRLQQYVQQKNNTGNVKKKDW